MRDKIITELRKIIPKNTPFNVTASQDGKFGHYSTNVAFSLAKKTGRSSTDVARELAGKIKLAGFLNRVEVAPPGFVNFWLEESVFQKELQEVLKRKSSYGRGKKRKEKIQVEFVSANPTGPLTLANGRGGFLGDVLSNILEASGYQIEREYYVNDTGNQIIILGKSLLAAAGLVPEEDYFYKGAYIKSWANKHKTIVKRYGNNPLKLGQLAARDFLKSIKNTLKKSGIYFDRFTSEEKDIHKKSFITKALKIFKIKGLIYKKDGAAWLKTTAFRDDKDRVLITSDGFPTYFLSDAGHYLEMKIRGFKRKINILGPDHHGYVGRIQAAAEIIGLKNSEIIVTQAVRLMRAGEEVRMSKRKGEFITFEELIDEVGVDAARFFFLMVSPDTHMDFDLALAKERSVKNPVYYVQYAHVRAESILSRAKKIGGKPQMNLLNTEDDFNLMRKLAELPEVLEDTASDLQAHRLSRYATELARIFHNFYEKERVIGEEKNLASARLALVRASAVILKNLLDILGISAPKKM